MSGGVPNHDVCRLSYYLHSVTVGCKLPCLDGDLVAFQRARSLSLERADEVFRLAYTDLRPAALINKVIFYDEGLCGGSNNKWFDVRQVRNFLDVPRTIVLFGRRREITKVLVFKKRWLEYQHKRPLKTNWRRLKRIFNLKVNPRSIISSSFEKVLQDGVSGRKAEDEEEVKEDDEESEEESDEESESESESESEEEKIVITNHCIHCQGMNGDDCECRFGCPVKDKTRCTAVDHCLHCKGFKSRCMCPFGCPPGPQSLCFPVHKSKKCDSCQVGNIRGAIYECTDVEDVNLCEKCYQSNKGRQDLLSYSFQRRARVGSTPEVLAPRQPPPEEVSPPAPAAPPAAAASVPPPAAASIPPPDEPLVAAAAPMTSTSTKKSKKPKKEKEEVTKGRVGVGETIAVATPLVDAVPVASAEMAPATVVEEVIPAAAASGGKETSNSGFEVGEKVELWGLKKDSMNGVLCIVEQDSIVPGGRVQVRLQEKKPGALMGVLPKNLKRVEDGLREGQLVMFKGLSNTEMNGTYGVVERLVAGGVRVMVRVSPTNVVSAKPQQLQLIADTLD